VQNEVFIHAAVPSLKIENLTAEELAKKLRLSLRGADFLISKLKREGKM